jgi:hypothetical protein
VDGDCPVAPARPTQHRYSYAQTMRLLVVEDDSAMAAMLARGPRRGTTRIAPSAKEFGVVRVEGGNHEGYV